MVFSSLTFLCLFLPLLLMLYYAVRGDRARNVILLLASLLFYGWGEPVWILAMLFSTAVNFFCARRIVSLQSTTARKLCLTLGVIVSIIFLVYFKYAAFFVNSFCALFGSSFRMQEPGLPIGISFYTFQILTYTVDVYRGKAKVQQSPVRLLLYVSCFPQLIAGPIVQYADVEDQLAHRAVTVDDFTAGFQRFVAGLSRKVLLANLCGAILEETALAGTGAEMSLLGAWASAFLYTLQIYFDFSAYSDMAIGLGRMFGFTYLENFNYPYTAVSVTDFWRRWHISLSSFFRDYVYIPLGGNRRGKARTALNMMAVWMLTGLWHGASWNFIAWGLYYGVLLLIERFVLHAALEKLPKAVRHVLTFLVVIVGWVIFYYTDFAAVGQHLLAMLGVGKTAVGGIAALPLTDAAFRRVWKKYTVFPLLAFLLALPLPQKLKSLGEKRAASALRWAGTAAFLALDVVFLIGQSYNPFIYFRF